VSERRKRIAAWSITFVAYATYYTGRKGFSAVKKPLHDSLGISEATLGLIDTVYLCAYALGQFVSGVLGDRVGARRLVGFGMLLSAACCAAFGSSRTALFFGIAFCINGLAQSTGWPGTTRAMAEWTTLQNRGTVMAFWSTCYQVGGLLATFLAGKLLGLWGWPAVFYGPAVLMSVVALLVFTFLRRGPSARAAALAESASVSAAPVVEAEVPPSERGRAQRQVLKNPVLWCYGASYFFVKFIRYTLLFWQPYYLAHVLGYPAEIAVYVSGAFEAGGIVGVILLGVFSDRLRRWSRSAVAALGLLALAGTLLAYSRSGTGVLENVILLALVGAALFGPDALLAGAAAQDAGGPHAAAMATGFVNGVGSIGAVLTGVAVPVISGGGSWKMLFPLLTSLAIFASAALLPTLKRGPTPSAA
jgi:sugar phosphate permease